MFFDLGRIQANIRQADTEDLLDRITVWRADMEPEALGLIEEELRRRDVSPTQVDAHGDERRKHLVLPGDGRPTRCSRCFRPAVESVVGWHKIWGWVPVFRRHFGYCEKHRPN